MIVAKSYSLRDAYVLGSQALDSFFPSPAATAPTTVVARKRPSPRSWQAQTFSGHLFSTVAVFDQAENTTKTSTADNLYAIGAWLNGLSSLDEEKIGDNCLHDSGTSEKSTQVEAFRWYLSFKYLASTQKYREALDLLFGYTEDAFELSDFHKLDCILGLIKPTDLSAEMLISVLRATSRAKASLANWQSLLRNAKSLSEKEGLPSRALRGL